jgi:hypothetical protein
MNLLALWLDGPPAPPPVWRLFAWCVFFPLLTITVSWVLIRWKKSLVALAVSIAATAAYVLLNQCYNDILIREHSKSRLEGVLQFEETHSFPVDTVKHEELLRRIRYDLQSFDSRIVDAIPPYTQRMIMTVWFSALFPIFLIIAFYLTAQNPVKARESLPTTPDNLS